MKDRNLRRTVLGRLMTRKADGSAAGDVGDLVKQLADRLGGRRIHVAVIPTRWTDDEAKRLTRLIDWTLEGDLVRLTALECCRLALEDSVAAIEDATGDYIERAREGER